MNQVTVTPQLRVVGRADSVMISSDVDGDKISWMPALVMSQDVARRLAEAIVEVMS